MTSRTTVSLIIVTTTRSIISWGLTGAKTTTIARAGGTAQRGAGAPGRLGAKGRKTRRKTMLTTKLKMIRNGRRKSALLMRH